MIQVRDLGIQLGEFALHDINLTVEQGEYMVVMGPTGSGKTVLVECIAGLYRPQRGQIWIGGQCVNEAPPEARKVAYVPQDYCLFPHMTVRQNIAYGMRLRRLDQQQQDETIQRLASVLSIEHILNRRPLHLSGGEQQRVALARALAVEPRVLLLDEPLSALDPYTRDCLCEMLKGLQRQFGVTTIHVCHNLDEALRVADRIAVFGQGTILQVGDADMVITRPVNAFVARYVGAANVIEGRGRRDGGQSYFEAGGLRLACADVPEGPCTLVARPEALMLNGRAEEGCSEEGCMARVLRCVRAGPVVWVDLEVQGGPRLRSCISAFDQSSELHPGVLTTVALRPGHGHFVNEPQ